MPNPPRRDPNRTAPHAPADPRTIGPEPSGASNTGNIGDQITPSRSGTPAAPPPGLPVVPGHTVLGELARGGMGVVYKARDLTLDRDVAIKVLLPGFPAGEAAKRFVREAKITAQLSHPSIPPVHHLGTLADGRPYLAMKLIEGRTLTELLKAPDRSLSLPQLVQVFEQICQAVGFAHGKGFVHRDLKPHNVMVGAFAEVQLMDWGLAKDNRPRAADAVGSSLAEAVEYEGGAPIEDEPSSELGGDTTRPGTVLGTLTYMAPEQARGDVRRVGPAADVFSLGGLLCAILTGRPPYTGGPAEIAVKAEMGMLDDALARLDACVADPELIAVCKQCLARSPADRPANAGEVAKLIAEYRNGVEARLRRSEQERAAAAVRSAERRKRRRLRQTVGGLAAVILLGGAGFAWWQDRQDKQAQLRQAEFEADRKAEAAQAEADRKAALAQAEADRKAAAALVEAKQKEVASKQEGEIRQRVKGALELAADLRAAGRFKEARRELDQARTQAAGGLTPDLVPEVDRARADLEFVAKLDEIRMLRSVWIPPTLTPGQKAPADPKEKEPPPDPKGQLGFTRIQPNVLEPGGLAFVQGKGQFDTAKAPREYRAAFLAHGFDLEKGDPAALAAQVNAAGPIKAHLVAALDDWAVFEKNIDLRDNVLTVARLADPANDPGKWTDRFRDPAVFDHDGELRKVAEAADPAALSPAVVVALADLMKRHGMDPSAVLRTAQLAHPDDFLIAFTLGQWYQGRSDRQAIGAYLVARALRPDNHAVLRNLGTALRNTGDLTGAIVTFKKLVELDPQDPDAHYELGLTYVNKDDWDPAIAEFNTAVKLDDRHARAYAGLGLCLREKKDLVGAVRAFRKATECDDTLVAGHYGLGATLQELRNRKETFTAVFGIAFPDTGDLKEAVAALKAAARLDPDNLQVHIDLGVALTNLNDWAGAEQAFRRAVELDDRNASAHLRLGICIFLNGKMDEGIAEIRRAVDLDPKDPLARDALRLALSLRTDRNERINSEFGIRFPNP
jgi:tetratricopeptide (TPR) repeat protein